MIDETGGIGATGMRMSSLDEATGMGSLDGGTGRGSLAEATGTGSIDGATGIGSIDECGSETFEAFLINDIFSSGS